MRVEDLNISELVEFDPEEGVIRFAGQRSLIIDATAKGNPTVAASTIQRTTHSAM